METERHRRQMNLLVESLEDAWSARDDFYVAGNMGLYFSETQALRADFRAPDVFVVLGTERRERKRWVVWEEDGLAPDVVVEITSKTTEHVDRGRKKDIYARAMKVAFYAVYDPFSAQLDAWSLDLGRRAYVDAPRDERGYAWCEPLSLWLGVVPGTFSRIEAPWLRWIDRAGVVLPHAQERAKLETERAKLETERAATALAELAELREELRRRG